MSDESAVPAEAAAVTTHYPHGGRSTSLEGPGIFHNETTDEPVGVWVDTNLRGRIAMIHKLEAEGAKIISKHWEDTAQILILSPSSTKVFDMYCHSDWMSTRQYEWYMKKRRKRLQMGLPVVEEEWQKKVMVKEVWLDECLEQGRFLGEEEGWGGMRAGGPTVDMGGDQWEQRLQPVLVGTSQAVDSLAVAEVSAEEGQAAPTEAAQQPDQLDIGSSDSGVPMEIDTEEVDQHIEPHNPTALELPAGEVPTDDAMSDQEEVMLNDGTPVAQAIDVEKIQSTESQPFTEADGLSTSCDQVPAADAAVDTTSAKPLDAQPEVDDSSENKQADIAEDAEDPSARGYPGSPVTLMRERNGQLEVIPREETDEEEEEVEEDEEVEEVEDRELPPTTGERPSDEQTPAALESTAAPPALSSGEDISMDTEPAPAHAPPESIGDAPSAPSANPSANAEAMVEDGSQTHTGSQPLEYAVVEASQDQPELQLVNTADSGPSYVPDQEENAEAGPSTPLIQSPKSVEDPSKLFEGYRFWVDLKRPNRRDLINRIKAAGGQLVATYDSATHVLVHDPRSPTWPPIIAQLVRQGIWFMHFSWIDRCLDDNIRYHELGEHINGGAPILLDEIEPIPHRTRRRQRDGSRMSSMSIRGSVPGSLENSPVKRIKRSPVSPEARTVHDLTGEDDEKTEADELHRLFDKAYKENEGSISRIVEDMQKAIPGKYRSEKWRNLYKNWCRRVGRFNHIPHVYPSREELETFLPEVDQMLEELKSMRDPPSPEKLVNEACDILYFQFPFAFPSTREWEPIWKDWSSKSGRFDPSASPSKVFPAQTPQNGSVAAGHIAPSAPHTSLARQRENRSPTRPRARVGSTDSVTTTSPHMSRKGKGKGYNSKLSVEELCAILEAEYPKVRNGSMLVNELAGALTATHGKYTAGYWRNTIGDWIRGEGRFKRIKQEELGSTAQPHPESATVIPPQDPHTGADDSPRVRFLGRTSSMTNEEIGRLLTDLLPELRDHTLLQAGSMLHRDYPVYSIGTWSNYYSDWRRGTGKFNGYGKEYTNIAQSDGSTSQVNTTYLSGNYGDLRYQTPSLTNTTQHPDPSVSSQGSKPEGSSQQATQGHTDAAPGVPLRRKADPYTEEEDRAMAKYIVDRLPKTTSGMKDWEDFTAQQSKRTNAAITQHYATHQTRIAGYAREYAATLPHPPTLPPHLLLHTVAQSAARNGSSSTEDRGSSRVRERHSRTPTATPSRRSTWEKWTDEEERAMARYIIDRLPTLTSTMGDDWEDFVKQQTKRSRTAVVTHFSTHHDRIYRLAREYAAGLPDPPELPLGLKSPIKREGAGASDTTEDVEIIEVKSDDSEDGDFVDMTMDSD